MADGGFRSNFFAGFEKVLVGRIQLRAVSPVHQVFPNRQGSPSGLSAVVSVHAQFGSTILQDLVPIVAVEPFLTIRNVVSGIVAAGSGICIHPGCSAGISAIFDVGGCVGSIVQQDISSNR